MASKLLFFWQFLRNTGRNHIIKKLKQLLSFSPVYFHCKQQQDLKIKMLSSNNRNVFEPFEVKVVQRSGTKELTHLQENSNPLAAAIALSCKVLCL